MREYTIKTNECDDNYENTFTADTLEEAREEAASRLREPYVPVDTTTWLSGELTWGEDNNERVEVTLHPEPPKCCEDEHDWQNPHEIVGGLEENPGVFGHGGGVVCCEICMHCYCSKVTDTWAQDPSTGVQGLESVVYDEERYENLKEEE